MTGETPFWTIHRALQIYLLHRLDEDLVLRQRVFESTLSLVRNNFPRQSETQAPSNNNWVANETALRHTLQLQRVYQTSKVPIDPPPAFAELLGDVGNYLWERALYDQGIETLDLAERIYESHPSWNPMQHSYAATILGVLSQEVGISGRKRGLDLCFKSLELRKQYVTSLQDAGKEPTESDWLLLGNSWNDMACTMLEFSSFSQAEMFLDLSMKIKRKARLTESKASFHYAENLKNLAIVRISQGRFKEAVDLSTQALCLMERKERGSGPKSASTQSFRFHRGYCLFYAGNYDAAYNEHDMVRKSRENIYGRNEVHTLNSYYACALMSVHLGQLTRARYVLNPPPIVNRVRPADGHTTALQ